MPYATDDYECVRGLPLKDDEHCVGRTDHSRSRKVRVVVEVSGAHPLGAVFREAVEHVLKCILECLTARKYFVVLGPNFIVKCDGHHRIDHTTVGLYPIVANAYSVLG